MVVAEERAAMDSKTSFWPRLITLVCAPLEDVVESAETSDEGGIHLMKALVHSKTLYYMNKNMKNGKRCYLYFV